MVLLAGSLPEAVPGQGFPGASRMQPLSASPAGDTANVF